MWCSIESNKDDIRAIGGSVYVYGNPTLMYLSHCPNQVINGDKCDKCRYNNEPILYDNGKNHYSVSRVRVANCYFELKSRERIDIRGLISSGKVIDYTNYVGSSKSVSGWWNTNI